MFSYALTRFQKAYVKNDLWRRESVHEAEVRTYWAKIPVLQKLGGRNLRFSPLHERQCDQITTSTPLFRTI